MTALRLAAAQLDLVVGDLAGNGKQIITAIRDATAGGCHLVAFPELAITGYPPEDLLLKPAFVAENLTVLDEVAGATTTCAAIVGFVDRGDDGRLHNALAVCAGGGVVGVYRKRHLPNYAVFDEQRYFVPGTGPVALWSIGGVRIGTTICEDAWFADGPVAAAGRAGAELVVNINASPYHAGKVRERESMLGERAAEAGCPILYVNLVGGQDELVFDGASLLVGADGTVLSRAPQYTEQLWITEVDVPARAHPPEAADAVDVAGPAPLAGPAAVAPPAELLGATHEVYEALVLGTRDYVEKNGFREVVIGLSGGVDSSLVAMVAVDALGPDRVHGVLMPSRFSSDHSVSDAERLSAALGIDHRTIAIEPAHRALLDMLAPSFDGREPDLTEENLQSRIRGVVLMALSNKFGWLVLTTGNKSESAVGYSTLYGDTAGGFAVIKDCRKLLVYELCRDRNRRAGRELVPGSVLTKPPSAELRPDQRDDQSLPPYEELDPIIEAYVERDLTAAEVVAEGHDPEVVRRITRLVDLAEYKRRQSPPGVRITTKAFGKDRRLPITNGFR
jgi:NAD+ synthase (glutamine-hydrolysing)